MSSITPHRLAELLGQWRQGGPVGERLAATLRALVLDGRIPLQSRLPAERALAAELYLSRATVTHAYERLREEGYVSSRQGSGSWVTIPGGHRAASDAITAQAGLDLRIAALPAPACLAELAAHAAGELPRWLDHHGYEPLGLPPLRDAIAARFTARGLPTTPEQILVTNGALQALDLAVRTLLPRGRSVLVEIPSYPAALEALRAGGARLRTIPVSAEGWDLAALDAATRTHEPALAYLMPDFQNPTGALVDDAPRRRAMWALRRSNTYLVVDETFAELALDVELMPAPLAAAGGARTLTVGSLSKSVWGGLRVGWIRADPAVIGRLATTRASADMASPVLEQLLATRVMQRLEEILAERRATIATRRDALCAALARHLPDWRYAKPAGGMFIWAQLPEPISTSLSVLAGERGVALTPGPRFGAAGLLERFLRLPYCLPPDQLERAVMELAQVAPSAGAHRRPPAGTLSYVA